jgi:hypothetical protein
VNLLDFYSYRIIGKLTTFLQLQEFSQRNPTVTSSTSTAPRSHSTSKAKLELSNFSFVNLVFVLGQFAGRSDNCYASVDNIRVLFQAVTGWFKENVQERNETLKSCQDKNAKDMAELALTGTTLPLLDVISSLVQERHPATAQLAREDAQLAQAILDVRDCLTSDLWRSHFTREYVPESDNWNHCLTSETMPAFEQHCLDLVRAFRMVLDGTNSLVYKRHELSTIFEATCADGWLRKFVTTAEARRWTEDTLTYCFFKKLDPKTRKWMPDDNPGQVRRDLVALLNDTFYKLRRLNTLMSLHRFIINSMFTFSFLSIFTLYACCLLTVVSEVPIINFSGDFMSITSMIMTTCSLGLQLPFQFCHCLFKTLS